MSIHTFPTLITRHRLLIGLLVPGFTNSRVLLIYPGTCVHWEDLFSTSSTRDNTHTSSPSLNPNWKDTPAESSLLTNPSYFSSSAEIICLSPPHESTPEVGRNESLSLRFWFQHCWTELCRNCTNQFHPHPDSRWLSSNLYSVFVGVFRSHCRSVWKWEVSLWYTANRIR